MKENIFLIFRQKNGWEKHAISLGTTFYLSLFQTPLLTLTTK